MRQFFKGWRRKVGCVLLAITATMAIAWCVSFRALCWWDLAVSKTSGMKVLAGDGCLTTVTFQNASLYNSTINCGSNRDPQAIYRFERENYVWIMRSPHIRYGREVGTKGTIITLSVSFTLIVIPLTLLSAYLILRKPRQRPEPTDA